LALLVETGDYRPQSWQAARQCDLIYRQAQAYLAYLGPHGWHAADVARNRLGCLPALLSNVQRQRSSLDQRSTVLPRYARMASAQPADLPIRRNSDRADQRRAQRTWGRSLVLSFHEGQRSYLDAQRHHARR